MSLAPRAAVAFALLCAGCSGLAEERFPTGSTTALASASGDAVYVVDDVGGALHRIDMADGGVRTLDVGGEPTRLARWPGGMIASLRAEGSVAVIVDDGELRVERRVEVGVEPFGVVANEAGTRLYVAISREDRVVELGADLEVLRSWTVPFEPRWPALHPSGRALYVGSAFDGAVAWIDLTDDDAGVRRVTLPGLVGEDLELGTPIDLTRRVTGDLTVSPDGRLLAVPMLYVDNVSEVDAPNLEAVTSTSYAARTADNDRVTGRFSPVATLVELDARGVPGGAEAVSLAVIPDGDAARRSYPASLTFSPGGGELLATQEGSSVVVAIPTEAAGGERRDEIGAQRRSLIPISTLSGPRGVAFVGDDHAVVHTVLDEGLADLRFGTVARTLPRDGDRFEASMSAERAVRLPEPDLPRSVLEGRRLFYSADDRRAAGPGAGVSCSTCHFDGRTDGLTWPLEGLPRQTPSLAGAVSRTAPVTWADAVPTVQEEVIITSQGRMGGRDMSELDAADVAAFVDWTRLPLPAPSDAADVAAGRALFEREDVGCAECHTGPEYTDNEPYDLFGEEVLTRSLLGIGASAPYLHDGSASSLGEMLERVRDGSMGDTSALSVEELRQLEAFLLSL